MYRSVTLLACAAYALVGGLAAGHAQSPAKPVPKFETEPFSGSELTNGKRIPESECADLAGAVWVVVEGKGECIRYYLSNAGGSSAGVLFFIGSDHVSVNERHEAKPYDFYLKETPAALQNASASWSRNLRVPYVHLARPGTEGSSGEHSQRRTARELDLISAAIEAIKARHGYERIHLVGYGEGGHAAAALMAKRSDLGCVVLASGLVSLRSMLAENGRTVDVTGNKTAVDPIALVDRIGKRPELRIFVVTDPDDIVISARSQTLYAKRLGAAGLAARQIFAAAPDAAAHGLFRAGREIAASCARGTDDEAIVAGYQNKPPQTPPDADDPPLHAADVMTRGVNLNEQCKGLGTGLWVRAEGRNFCVRYWLSTAGGAKDEAQVFFDGDLGDNRNPRGVLNAFAARITAGRLLREAQAWSRLSGAPYATMGRLGSFGSSGNHMRERRSLLEVRVAMAALDGLKEKHGFKRLHLVGQSGGGHTVAALAQMRSDIGCAVMASAVVSVKSAQRDLGRQVGALIKTLYDPIDHVAKMQRQPGLRMIVLTDPDDRAVSSRSQREFVERVRSHGLPILQITAAAGDENFHGLASVGKRLAADCAKGVDDETLIKRYQTKTAPVASRR